MTVWECHGIKNKSDMENEDVFSNRREQQSADDECGYSVQIVRKPDEAGQGRAHGGMRSMRKTV